MPNRTRFGTSFTMECAHRLPRTPNDHHCTNIHGHTYKVDVELSGVYWDESGMIFDFGLIKKTIHGTFDHRYLNEVFKEMGFPEDPTAEVLSNLFRDMLDEVIRPYNQPIENPREWIFVERVRVQEGPDGWAEYCRKEDTEV